MIRLRASERMLILGMTQSGKSTLATALATGWERVLVYDPKHDAGAVPPGAAVCYGVDAALRALPGRVVYRPLPWEQGRGVRRLFDRLVGRVINTGGAHGIVIHELGDLAPESGAEPYLSAAYRQGASQRIPIIACSQRPRRIDVSAKSESDHFALFQLQYDDDVEHVSRLFGIPQPALSVELPPYWFHHRGPDRVVRRMPPIALKPTVEAPPTDVSPPPAGHDHRLDHRRRASDVWVPGRRPRAQ